MTNVSEAHLNNGAAVRPLGEAKESPSTFPAYPAYKDSEVEWLGAIPEHWSALPVKSVGWLKGGAGFPHDKQGIDSHELDFHKVNALASADSDGVLRSSVNTITRETAKELGAYVFPKGTIVFAKVGAALLLGRLRTISAEACLDNNMMGLIAFQRKVSIKFILYSAGTIRFDLIANPGTVPSLNEDRIGNYRLAIPSLTEQAQIARFLDHETARIDALIEEQQRLIELLKEKRQTVISRAVTKGLDPTVPMKDSGVEWLGEVPAHWSFKQSKYLLEFVTSGSRGWAEYYSDDGDLFFRITNLTRDSIEPKLLSTQQVTPPKSAEGERSKVRCGDILISITADLGSVCVANNEIAGSYVSQHVALARPNRKSVFSRWFAYFVLSDTCKAQLIGAGYGGTKVQLSLDDIRSFWVSLPPYEEQVSLATFLDREIQAFDGLIAQAAIGMDLLSVRRAALISAAVTGKIDVRGWQLPVSTASTESVQEAM